MEFGGRIREVQALSAVREKGTFKTGLGESVFRAYLKDAIQKERTVFQEGGDVVMSYPPLMAVKYGVDMSKPVEDMTMDEYKQYLCNRVSALPVSTGMRIGGSGVLVFKEEAFENMKENREYEEAVLGMLAEKCVEEVPAGILNMPKVSYQVIGASLEESYGAEIPVKNYGLDGSLYGSLGQNSALYGLTGMDGSLYGLAGSLYGMAGLGGFPLAGGSGFLSGVSGMSAAYAASNSAANRSGMINAYRKTLEGKSGDTSIRRYIGNWREN